MVFIHQGYLGITILGFGRFTRSGLVEKAFSPTSSPPRNVLGRDGAMDRFSAHCCIICQRKWKKPLIIVHLILPVEIPGVSDEVVQFTVCYCEDREGSSLFEDIVSELAV